MDILDEEYTRGVVRGVAKSFENHKLKDSEPTVVAKFYYKDRPTVKNIQSNTRVLTRTVLKAVHKKTSFIDIEKIDIEDDQFVYVFNMWYQENPECYN